MIFSDLIGSDRIWSDLIGSDRILMDNDGYKQIHELELDKLSETEITNLEEDCKCGLLRATITKTKYDKSTNRIKSDKHGWAKRKDFKAELASIKKIPKRTLDRNTPDVDKPTIGR